MTAGVEMGLSGARLALAVKRLQSEMPQSELLLSTPIAVIGMGCRLGGGVKTPADFWKLLVDGTDAVVEVPPSRWVADEWFDPDPAAPGKATSRWGSFVDAVDEFDPAFFGIAPREAASMDPQQRLILEVAWESLWDAGIAPDRLAGTPTGVFVAVYNTDFGRLQLAEPSEIGPNTCAGSSFAVASGRISFLLDLQGPSTTVNTACSSSLVAVHLACQSLRQGESKIAIAGGANLYLTPEHYVEMAKLGMLSPTGRCSTFDHRANGFVPGEGCGMIVLKRLADALADGDRIRAIIRGSATGQDGRTTVLTAPSGLAQEQVVRRALENARISPEQIGYVETHGTGTPLGDPIEIDALAQVLVGTSPCALGCAKTNLGHLEAAAGIAGLIKAVLVLENERVPPNLHFEKLNPHISLAGTRFVIPTEPIAWTRGTVGRFAGVSSFGFGGTNVHVVLEEAPKVPPRPDEPRTVLLLPISARTPDALTALAERYDTFLDDVTSPREVCRAAALGRSHYEERIAVVGSTAAELRAGLREMIEGRPRHGAARGRVRDDPGVVFVFSGQGSQWVRMGSGLLKDEPAFRNAIETMDWLIRGQAGWSLLEQLQAGETESRFHQTEFAQPAIFAIEVALTRLWQSWGVEPALVVGHSVGEITAAHIAGVLDLAEAVRLVVHRGRLMERAAGSGRMASVQRPLTDVRRDIARFGERLSVAAVNGPQSIVISGEPSAVEEMTREWQECGVECRPLKVDYAFHSAQMEPYRTELIAALGSVRAAKPTIPMISTVTSKTVSGPDLDAAYWGRNIRQPVMFGDSVAAAISMGFETFLEVGPHPVLSLNVQEGMVAADCDGAAIPSLRRGQDERTSLLGSLGALYVRGLEIDWSAVYPGPRSVVPLPVYPYQRQSYPIPATRALRVPRPAVLRPLLHRRVRSPLAAGDIFETELSLEAMPFLGDHRIGEDAVVPMAALVEMVLEAVTETSSRPDVVLEDILIRQPLAVPERGMGSRTVQLILEDGTFRIFALEGEKWTSHATGRFRTGSLVPDGSGSGILRPVDIGEHYQRAWDRGAHFGASFRTVVELSAANGEATATVKLTDAVASDSTPGWVIHPTLLDGCLQTLFAAEPTADGPVWIPIAIDRFELRGAAPSTLCSVLRLVPDSGAGETLAADLWITDGGGQAVARVSGLRLRRMRAATAAQNRVLYKVAWRPQPRFTPIGRNAQSGRWLIVGNEAVPGVGERLRGALELRGESSVVVTVTADAATLGASGYRGTIYVGALEGQRDGADSRLEPGCRGLLALLQTMAQAPAGTHELWVVTCDAHAIVETDRASGFAQTAGLGLLRTAALEHPDIACHEIDLDAGADVGPLVEELLHSDGERRIAFRSGARYLPRLERVSAVAPHGYRLTVPIKGTIESLRREPMERRPPAAGEVEVSVDAAALNFRDVLNVLGMYPGEAGPLGLEFAGRIERVGAGVDRWKPGDRVIGIGWGSFASHVVTLASLVMPMPAGLGAVAAATLPNAFLTAHHCLVRAAKLERGESVLIHAGAGGVGMAAIQLALDIGAVIFATAGSEEKRAYLRTLGVDHVLDSRSLAFSGKILEVTGGRGVDVVLNSLSGDFIGASFSALGANGRFVEIGKMGLWSAEQVAALSRDIDYTVVDLGPVIDETPAVIGQQLDRLTELLAAGRIHPLPYRLFAFDDAEAAFRYMAQARHIGRVVLSLVCGPPIRADVSYLVTGGLGDIGLRVASWLVERGARHLMLVGRSAPSGSAAAAIARMREAGAAVEIRTADVSDRAAVTELIGEFGSALPALRGVIHAAGVVDDGIVIQQTWDRVRAVMAPKMNGAWNLHEATFTAELDFFLLFGSIAAVFGSPGQSGYAAGNAFLDGLAVRRQAMGLPALSIDWGAWAGIGMASRVEERGKRLGLRGVRPMAPSDCIGSLEAALGMAIPQALVVDADWSAWPASSASLLGDLVQRSSSRVHAKAPGPGIAKIVEQAPESARRRLLMDWMALEARNVLGLPSTHPIDERQPLLKLGLDSLMSVELRNRLAAGLERSLPATLLFDYPSPSLLADFILGVQRRPAVSEPDALLREIVTMSDAEAEELLERELGAA